MLISSYLVGRDLGKPVQIVVSGTLPCIKDDSLIFAFEVGERIAGDKFGQNLFLTWMDASTGNELLDIVLPSIPEDVVDTIMGGEPLELVDTESSSRITLQQSKSIISNTAA